MERLIGLINSGIINETYDSLCNKRPVYMLPYGGRYRIIDFALSTMSNHNISNVVVYGVKNIRSTLDHIGNGQPWELNRKNDGIFIFPPLPSTDLQAQSDISSYFQTLTFYEQASQENIYFDNPMTIMNVNIQDAYEKFLDENLDILILYKRMIDREGKYLYANKLIRDIDGSLLNIGINLGTEDIFDIYLGKLFTKKQVFIDLVKDATEKANAVTLRQAIINNRDKLKIGLYEIESHVEIIRDTKSFYDANMNLLNPEIYDKVFFDNYPVYTKSKDEPSTFYHEDSKVRNSLIANGCIIEGQVENSIVFRGVHIGKNAIVRNSIIMQKSKIEEGAIVINSISDKYGVVEKGASVVGNQSYPYVIKKATILRKD